MLSFKTRCECTKTAIRVFLKSSCHDDDRMCFKLVDDETYMQLKQEVLNEREGSEQEPFLFNRQEMLANG